MEAIGDGLSEIDCNILYYTVSYLHCFNSIYWNTATSCPKDYKNNNYFNFYVFWLIYLPSNIFISSSEKWFIIFQNNLMTGWAWLYPFMYLVLSLNSSRSKALEPVTNILSSSWCSWITFYLINNYYDRSCESEFFTHKYIWVTDFSETLSKSFVRSFDFLV